MPISECVRLGVTFKTFHPTQVNLYGCVVGDYTKIGSFVEILQKGATVGAPCKVPSHSFICEGVTIEDEVFIGHGLIFTNDRFPCAANADGIFQTEADWKVGPTLVKCASKVAGNCLRNVPDLGKRVVLRSNAGPPERGRS